MVVFLTSSFVEYQPKKYVPKPVDASNGFVENLKRYWPDHARFLVFACDPSNAREADHVTEEMHDAFSLAGFFIEESDALTTGQSRHIGKRPAAPKQTLQKTR